MWHIREIKRRANLYLHTAYWRSVLTALVLAFVMSGVSTAVIELGLQIMAAMPQVDIGAIYYELNMIGIPVHPAMLEMALNVVFAVALVLTIIGCCVDLFLMKPVEVGCRRFYIVNRAMPGESRCAELFHVFGNHYLNVVWTMLLKTCYTILWSVLLVIPGAAAWWLLRETQWAFPPILLVLLTFPGWIKHYSYRFVPYILAEEPGMDFDDAFLLSRRMMKGNKFHAFRLDLSFLGWRILNIFTLGLLGVFYVGPYRHTANTELYVTLRDRYLHRT